MGRKLFYGLLGVLLLFLLLDPQTAFASSQKGLTLWFQTVLPSLLPFMILSNFLLSGRGIHRLLGHFSAPFRLLFGVGPAGGCALVLGLFCGYPMGAKLTADLWRSGSVTRPEADYLLAVSSNPSPAFLTSYLLAGTLGRPELAPICLAAVYGGFLLTSLLFRLAILGPSSFQNLRHPGNGTAVKAPGPQSPRSSARAGELSACALPENARQKEASHPLPLGKRIDASIMDGFTAITKLGGYILMFSILAGLMGKLLGRAPLLAALALGITEISTGAGKLAALPLPLPLSCSLIFACTAFGGLSIAAQASSMLQSSGLSLRPYLAGKCCCAIFTFLLCLLLFVVLV